jgi:hypothetical protein
MAARLLAILAVVLAAGPVLATNNEPPACLSPNPADWPAPSKPYFLVIADTSGSMSTTIATSNSCGYPNTRSGHLRCALRNVFSALAGNVNFGLATFATVQSGCSGSCYSGCSYSTFPGDTTGCGPIIAGFRAGANIVVPLAQDNFWTTPPAPSNVSQLLSWVDNDCTGSTELYATTAPLNTARPLNGALRDMYRYFAGTWTGPTGSPVPTPIGTAADGERACRSINVILVADGDEACDTTADAVSAASALFNGVTVGSLTFNIRTYVVQFIGGTAASMNQIAVAGGTSQATSTANEAQLTQALTSIVSGTLNPETCDNVDNNCNGCTDEGFAHYCDVGQTCCAASTPAQRVTCLANYQASITPGNPTGDRTLLPCTTAAEGATPATWLCYDPGDGCDGVDNDCNGRIDEAAMCGVGHSCVAGTCVP